MKHVISMGSRHARGFRGAVFLQILAASAKSCPSHSSDRMRQVHRLGGAGIKV